MKLVFGRGNAKLDALEKRYKTRVATFSVQSGVTCPYAKDCKSTAVRGSDGRVKIVDGPDTVFRCFSASQEALFPNVLKSRENNGDIIALAAIDIPAAAAMISSAIPKKTGIVRIHVGGDFKTKAYFCAWLKVAADNPSILFYAYTKSLPFWVWAEAEGIIPENMILTASYGGHRDDLIEKHGLRFAKVVGSVAEARRLKLPIDHDDSHAANPKTARKSFALLIHGAQPAGSQAGKDVRKLNGVGSYRKGKN